MIVAPQLYDDRLVRMLKAIRATPALDVRELIIQTRSTDAVHDQTTRPRPEQIEAIYQVDTSLKTPSPSVIGLFDDILTTGGAFPGRAGGAAESVPERPDHRRVDRSARAGVEQYRGFLVIGQA